MAIERVDDLFRWLEILAVRPAGSLTDAERANTQQVPGSTADHVGVPTGVRLADWRQASTEWTEADCAAIMAFIDERVRPWLVAEFDIVRRCQEALLESATTPAGMLATMWRAGCHPLQDDDTNERDLPPRDLGARLGALLRLRALLRGSPSRPDVPHQTRDRLEGALAMCEQHLAIPTLANDASLAEWIDALRAADPLATASECDQEWFPTQVAIECESLWNGAGPALRQLDRAAYDIIELAALSGVNAAG